MRWNKILKFFLIGAAFIAIDRFCHKETASFQAHKIASALPNDPRWDAPLPDEKQAAIDALLAQPFTFLGNGNECYAFLSADGTTVLKFFKQQILRPAYFRLALKDFSHFFERLQSARRERLERTFNSCKIAWDSFKDETGLLYLHLNHTEHLRKKLTFTDKLGIAHTIDLDTSKFLLQKRAELVYARLSRLIERGENDDAKKQIDALIELIAHRCAQGIADRDPRIVANFAFIGEQAVEIDTGSFSYDAFMREPHFAKRELFYISRELKDWLQKRSPELAAYLDTRINQVFDEKI